MRVPDPKANTTTEAYLAYKAGYLEESELKPVLYEPYLHFDAWLAYWAGLTTTYPVFSKNKFNIETLAKGGIVVENGVATGTAVQFYTQFQDGIELASTAPVMSITATAYRDGSSSSGNGITFHAHYTDGTDESIMIFLNSTTTATTLTATTDISKRLDHISIVYGSGSSNVWHLSNIQIEEGTVPTEYEPFDTPEMLCDEEALVAYLSGVTDTYPEDIKDPYDVRIVGYLRHLASVRWPEPDYPVNNEEFYLSTMEPTHTSNSEPSANIELDTAEGKIISVEAYGDTSQQTYTGKNQFNIQTLAQGSITVTDGVATGTAGQFYTEFQNGITLTSTASAMSITATAYRDGETSSGNGFIFRAIYTDETEENIVIFLNSTTTATTLTGTTDSSKTLSKIVIVYGSGSSNLWHISNIQIEAGSTATAYEPYVGGIASPNPDYPQDVKVVTGRQVVGFSGKNIFNKDAGDILNTVVDANGIGQNVPTSYRTVFAPCQPNTTYTVSKSLDSTRNRFCIAYTKTTPTYNMIEVYGKIVDNTKSVLTITTGADAKYIVAYVWISGGSVSADDMVASVQIEEGDQASSFEPYQGSDYEINLGKNLFIGNYSQFNNTGGYGTLYDYFKLPESGDYTLTIIAKNDIGAQSPQKFIGFTAQGGDATGGYVWAFAGSTVMQKGDVRSIRNTFQGNRLGYLSMYPKNEATLNWVMENFDIQLELGDTATPYAPYFEPIELCKIGGHQDYIYKSGDDWYLYKATGKVIYKGGTENWTARAGKEHTFQISAPTTLGGGFSNYFTPIAATGFDQVNGIYLGNTNVVIVSYPTISSVEDFKTWLSTHNLIIYYGRFNTSTDTKITNDALIGQLEALLDADTYDEKTYIRVTATDPNLPALLKVEAYKY